MSRLLCSGAAAGRVRWLPAVILCLLATAASAGGARALLGRGEVGGSNDDNDSDAGGGWAPPRKADMEALGTAAHQCLDGKHVQMIGNSVTRHWLFVLNDLVNGAGANFVQSSDFQAMRHAEKEYCGSSEDALHIDGKGCSAKPRNGSVHLEFVWQHPYFSDALDKVLGQRPGVTPPDVVLINLGINDLYHEDERANWKSLLVAQSEDLAEALGALPDSTYAYWRTTTRLCDLDGTSQHKEAKYFPMINRCLVTANAHMVDTLSRLAPKVHLFDAFEATKDCRGYMDHIHHPLAAIDHVLIFMSRYCGEPFGRKALAAFPHIAPHFASGGSVKPRKCRAQRAAVTEEDAWNFGDGWNWVNGLLSDSKDRKHEVAC